MSGTFHYDNQASTRQGIPPRHQATASIGQSKTSVFTAWKDEDLPATRQFDALDAECFCPTLKGRFQKREFRFYQLHRGRTCQPPLVFLLSNSPASLHPGTADES